MITYKVVEWTDSQKVKDFMLVTDALDYMFDRAVNGNVEHLELHKAETGCKYELLYTYRR